MNPKCETASSFRAGCSPISIFEHLLLLVAAAVACLGDIPLTAGWKVDRPHPAGGQAERYSVLKVQNEGNLAFISSTAPSSLTIQTFSRTKSD
jgi:hypothetical protein